jgi:hypothetical protein
MMLQFSNLQRCDRVIGRLSDGSLNMSIIFLIIALRLFIYLITSGTSKFERKNRRSRPRRKTERQPQVSMTSLFLYTELQRKSSSFFVVVVIVEMALTAYQCHSEDATRGGLLVCSSGA